MSDIDPKRVKRLANMAAGLALHDVLNVADFSERFPDEELREAVIDEIEGIANRLQARGEHPDRPTPRERKDPLFAETEVTPMVAERCPAAHFRDPTPCDTLPDTVRILTSVDGKETLACEHHGARMLASIEGGKVHPGPGDTKGACVRVFLAAQEKEPFEWMTGGRL